MKLISSMTLGTRLALFIFIIQTVVLSVFSIYILSVTKREMMLSFDDSLKAKAFSLAALVDLQDDEDDDDWDDYGEPIELELNNGIIPGASSGNGKMPDQWAVNVDGTILAKTGSMDIPEHAWQSSDEAVWENIEENGIPYRTVTTVHFRPVRNQIHVIRVHYASDSVLLQSQQSLLVKTVTTGAIICLILSALLAWIVAGKSLRPLESLKKSISDISGEISGYRITLFGLPPDLHPLAHSMNSMMERIEKAFDREREFSSDAAHELRSPLASLKSSLQASLLDHRDSKSSDERIFLEGLLTDVERMEKLCEALLLLTCGNSTNGDSSILPEEWYEEMMAALDCIRGLPEASDASFTLESGTENVFGYRVNTTRESIFRITENLVGNALRHGGASVSIKVVTRIEDGFLLLEVEDNGPGVSIELQDKLFQRFFRTDSARARNTGGYGLGLSICKALAESLGGSMKYERLPDGGSRFTWSVKTDRISHSQSEIPSPVSEKRVTSPGFNNVTES